MSMVFASQLSGGSWSPCRCQLADEAFSTRCVDEGFAIPQRAHR